MESIYKIDLKLQKAWVGENEAHDCQSEWSFWEFSELGALPFDFVKYTEDLVLGVLEQVLGKI